MNVRELIEELQKWESDRKVYCLSSAHYEAVFEEIDHVGICEYEDNKFIISSGLPMENCSLFFPGWRLE